MIPPRTAPHLPHRLLIVGLNYLGDALFTTPALAALRARFPHAQIDLLSGERALSIVDGATGADRLIVRPPRGGLTRLHSLTKVVRGEKYDAVILFQSILSNAVLAWMARIPMRIGFAQDGCAPFLTHAVLPRHRGEHVVDAYLRLAHAASPPDRLSETPGLRIALSQDDTAFAERFLRDRELISPIIGLVIGATRPQKRWPEIYWARLADRLWQTLGAASILLGGPEEQDAAQRILRQTRAPLASAIGQTSPKQLAALTARLSVVVSGDSGPLHIAVAMRTPVVALFGSTDPSETGPWMGITETSATMLYDDLACSPCRKNPTCNGRYDCMSALTPERTFEAILNLLPAEEKASLRRTALPMAALAKREGGGE